MLFSRVLTFWALFAILVALGNSDPEARLTNGLDVDTLRQFPFYVYITSTIPWGYKCAGAILNAQWVLTSAQCITGFTRFELSFGKKNANDTTDGYFSISVNRDQVYEYPTSYDDLALVKIPMQLVFSDTISPVKISNSSIDALRNKFAVMPGFETYCPSTPAPEVPTPPVPTTPPPSPGTPGPLPTTPSPSTNADNLKYGMFNILDQSACSKDLRIYNFNEYNQVCAEGWGSTQITPGEGDFGSALVIGWPAQTELVGIFSVFSPTCNSRMPSAFTFVPKYSTWINNMIQG